MGYRFRNDPLGETASRSEASNWDAVSARRPKRKVRPTPQRHVGTYPQPTTSSVDVSPDKTCQNRPVPFWQVLEADGEGDLMIVAGYGSRAAMGFGDGTHHG